MEPRDTEKQKANRHTKKGDRLTARCWSRLRMVTTMSPKKPIIMLLQKWQMLSHWGTR